MLGINSSIYNAFQFKFVSYRFIINGMFDPKNLSPRQLSFYTALVLAVPVSLIMYIVEQRWMLALGIFVGLLVTAYLIILVVLERFIYRKIKLIYKFIHKTKITRREETFFKYVLPPKSIAEVTDDVQAWAEESQEQMEQLRAQETYRKEFLQNLSHEFKTPIFAIQSYVEALLDGGLEDSKVNRRFLEKTSGQVQRLTNLLGGLDEISKLERGELRLEKTSFVIQDVVRDAFESLALLAEEKNVRFAIKRGCETPINVYADKEKISQVLLNLFNNSIKYSKVNGNVKVSSYKTDNERVLIEISDEGIGIPQEHLPRIFERFYRTEEGRGMDAAGSGLGLSICKHIIEAHGQTIHIRSGRNLGTTVGFTLDSKKEPSH